MPFAELLKFMRQALAHLRKAIPEAEKALWSTAHEFTGARSSFVRQCFYSFTCTVANELESPCQDKKYGLKNESQESTLREQPSKGPKSNLTLELSRDLFSALQMSQARYRRK